MKLKIFHNWGLKLISLIVAFVVWFLVVQVNDPQDTSSFSNVQVKITNTELLEKENKVYEILENTDKVRVTVRAPRSILKELRASDIIAEADMSKLTDINTIAITYDIQNVDTGSVEISGRPDVVKLNVEEKESKYIRVDYNVTGELTEGYFLGNVNLDQNRIRISGPKSSVDAVSRAGVEIDITNETNSLSADVEIHLYNKDKEEVTFDNLEKQMDYIHMTAEILPTKTIAVEAEYQGEPAQGYAVSRDIEINPESILIAGTARNIANVSTITIPAEYIDITEAKEDVELEFSASTFLPSSLRLADAGFDGKIKVKVPVEKLINTILRIPEDHILFVNVPQGMGAEIETADGVYELEVTGLSEDINALRERNIYGTVNVGAWMEEQGIDTLERGTYYMPVSFDLDENVELDTNPAVHVSIEIKESGD